MNRTISAMLLSGGLLAGAGIPQTASAHGSDEFVSFVAGSAFGFLLNEAIDDDHHHHSHYRPAYVVTAPPPVYYAPPPRVYHHHVYEHRPHYDHKRHYKRHDKHWRKHYRRYDD